VTSTHVDDAPPRSRPVARTAAAGRRSAPTRSWRHRLRRDRTLILMTMPAIGLLLLFNYLPMLGNVIAFQDYSPYVGFLASPFVGLTNFQRIVTDPLFWQAAGNTLTITGFQLVFYFPVPILLALLLNSVMSRRVRTAVQGVVYLPHFFSWVLVVTVFQQMLGGAGLLNQLLRDHNLPSFDIMTAPALFKVLVTSQAVWKDAGWGIIVFLAALSTVDSNLYEAAAVDGAGRWRRLWHVTLPALRPVVVMLLVLRLGDALTVGFEQMLLQRDAVGAGAAEVLDTYVYYTGIINGDFSYAAAAGLVKGVISVVLLLAANKLAHMVGEQGVYQR
jgi:putative aldouronate transport system permease protein